MGAKHSISILAWELSFSFGLIKVSEIPPNISLPSPTLPGATWVTLEVFSIKKIWVSANKKFLGKIQDILIDRSMAGVPTRIIIWQHTVLSLFYRWLDFGKVSLEHVSKKKNNEFAQKKI